ncbi:MAG: polymer-forming cytoskeletal protein [Flavobacteriales bacterium]|nr:polymer-forming cytoskeletal protein [Flavobacteriales bacterium]
MAKTQDINAPERLNRIVDGTIIEGTINSESNIRIDGTVRGTIKTKGRLVVGPKGRIEGDVICNNAEVEGTIDGQIKVNEILSLRATAKILGDIHTGKLAIEPGASFTGTCNMGGVVKNTSQPIGKEQQKQSELVKETA